MAEPNTAMFESDPPPKVITFDCYGTLVQWYAVLLSEIDVVLVAHDAQGADASEILDSFRRRGDG